MSEDELKMLFELSAQLAAAEARAERAEARAKLAELKAKNALVMVRELSGVRYLRDRAERAEAALLKIQEDDSHIDHPCEPTRYGPFGEIANAVLAQIAAREGKSD